MIPLLRRLANPPVICALVALAIYAITLNGIFIYDDVAIIETDRRIADPHLWGQYWTDSYNFGVDNLYRPLVSMSYAIQYWLHGPLPMPFHLVNWILHAVASALVAMFAMKLATRCDIESISARLIAFVAGLLFAAHPIHVEAVANVVGRAELMCAIGVIGAMHVFLGKSDGCPGACTHDPRRASVRGSTSTLPRGTQNELTRARVIGVYLCFVLALLSKEQGMLVPVLLGVMAVVFAGPLSLWEKVRARAPREPISTSNVQHSTFNTQTSLNAERSMLDVERSDLLLPSPQPSPRRRGSQNNLAAMLFVLLAVTLAGYVSYRESILKFWWEKNFLDTWIQPLAATGVTLTDRLLVPITIIGRYLQLLVAPVTLRLDYGGLIVPGRFNPSDPYFILGIGAVLLWLALFAIALKQRDRFSILCLLCFALIYGLLGNLVTIIGVNMAERLMYLPSVFFVMIVARWLARMPTRVAMPIAGVLVILFAVRSITYAARWNDKLGFYIYSATVEPRSVKSVQLATLEFLAQGRLDEAEAFARRATTLRPDGDDVYLQWANVLIKQGKWAEAEAAIDKARQINPPGAWASYRLKLDVARNNASR